MRWDWLLDRHPEIAHLRPSEQQALLEAIRSEFLKDRRTWLLFLPLSLAPLTALLTSQRVSLSVLNMNPYWIGLPVAILGPVVAQFRVRHSITRDALRARLLREGVRPARCFDCGYDLRSVEGDRCPECGAALRGPA